jgi:thiamine-monophosphate kinase
MSGPSSRGPAIREREFHAWLARHLPAGRKGLLPLGDDAAALRPPSGRVAVLTTDAMVEGVHFLPNSAAADVGRAAAGVNLSDLAAKGAAPAALLFALIVPPGTPRVWTTTVSRAAERCAERYGARIVGGDTKPGPFRAVVGFALGWGRPGSLAPRTGARAGDLVVTTGVVGRGGLAASRLASAGRPSPRALSGLLDVRPRVAEGMVLARFAHAMLDTSDGLAEASRLLAEASRVRVVVEEGRLPLAPGVARASSGATSRRALAFFGGDYELLATLAPAEFRRAAHAVRARGGRITPIGRVEAGRGAWLAGRGGEAVPMPESGWQPFGRTRLPARGTHVTAVRRAAP